MDPAEDLKQYLDTKFAGVSKELRDVEYTLRLSIVAAGGA
jgi:hypothetical protein